MVLLFLYIFAITSIMKNIVLYTIPVLLLVFTESIAQKPTIDLLPSNHERPHPEAIIDTIYTKDTLVINFPVEKQNSKSDSEVWKGEIRKKGFLRGRFRGSEILKPGKHADSILYKLVLKNVKSCRILIFYITALNK